MQAKLTKSLVDKARPGPRDQFLWDSELRGLGIKVTPAGRKVYVLGYRLSNGRRRRYTLPGYHGAPWTVETARAEAKRLLGKIAQLPKEGEHQYDPVSQRKDTRSAETVEELAESFIKHISENRAPRTAYDYERILNNYVQPVLGKHRVTTVTESDVRQLHRSRKGAPKQADYMLAVLSSMFAYAEKEGLRQRGTNPCRDVEKVYEEEKHERFLSAAELARLGEVLANAERDGKLSVLAQDGRPERTVPIDPRAVALIRLAIFTGARPGELQNLQWDWIDEQRGIARLPAPAHKTGRKTGAKTIELNAPAMEVLGGLERFEGNPHVLPGIGSEGHLMNPYPTWYAVRDAAGLPDVRLYDIRHSFASAAVRAGTSLYMVQKLLGHTDSKTTQRYAHLARNEVTGAAEAVGQIIAQAMRGQPERDNIVALPSRARRPRKR